MIFFLGFQQNCMNYLSDLSKNRGIISRISAKIERIICRISAKPMSLFIIIRKLGYKGQLQLPSLSPSLSPSTPEGSASAGRAPPRGFIRHEGDAERDGHLIRMYIVWMNDSNAWNGAIGLNLVGMIPQSRNPLWSA